MQRAYATRGLRFLPKLTLAITIGLTTAAASYAVDVFTDPVGFITITAVGTSVVPESTSLLLIGSAVLVLALRFWRLRRLHYIGLEQGLSECPGCSGWGAESLVALRTRPAS